MTQQNGYPMDQVTEAIEQGAITQAYGANPESIIAGLNQLRSTEIISYLQYMQHTYMAVSLMSSSLKTEFQNHGSQELQHADRLANRIQQLGGVPIFRPDKIADSGAEIGASPKQGPTLTDMVIQDLMLERRQIVAYLALIREIGDQDLVTRRILIDILEETETHASELADYLKRANPETSQ